MPEKAQIKEEVKIETYEIRGDKMVRKEEIQPATVVRETLIDLDYYLSQRKGLVQEIETKQKELAEMDAIIGKATELGLKPKPVEAAEAVGAEIIKS